MLLKNGFLCNPIGTWYLTHNHHSTSLHTLWLKGTMCVEYMLDYLNGREAMLQTRILNIILLFNLEKMVQGHSTPFTQKLFMTLKLSYKLRSRLLHTAYLLTIDTMWVKNEPDRRKGMEEMPQTIILYIILLWR